MRKGLFREEVIAAQGQRLHGEVMITPSGTALISCIFIAAWAALVITFLSTQTYSRQATVAGWLEPDSGVLRVFADQPSGVISKVLIKDGQSVKQGQPLVIIDSQTALPSGASAQATIAAEYRTQYMMLEQQVNHTKSLHKHQLQNHAQAIAAYNEDIHQLTIMTETASEQTELARARYRKLQPLAGVHVPQAEVDNAYAQLLQHIAARQEKERQLSRLQQELKQKELAYTSLQVERDENLAILRSRMSEVNQKITQLESQTRFVVTARNDGIVANLSAREGQNVSTQQPLLTLLAPDAEIEAHFVVPVRSAGFIRDGQTLDIRYDAFPYQKFGMHQAIVSRISDTALLPSEFAYLPVAVKEPVYLARARLKAQQLTAYGASIKLRSGMTFSADVNLSERTLMEWLLEPLYSLSGRLV
ncbi:HlyD family secretion protein [Salinimonas chungwhensis]|uniref:HlyD family secretion protein n=1 Tax=Salinimonas chungwhensis TaxID=265425 RepID=UPI00037EA4DA|nr:HlyD family efflux transporter periplasmic adaptor subunit [Salinimonas chungwhensis]